MSRIEEIILHEKEADELQAQSDEHRWEAARLIAGELADGKTQQVLAEEIKKSQGHVSKCSAVWRNYSHVNNDDRPRWTDALEEVKSSRKLASELGCHHSTVAWKAKSWNLVGCRLKSTERPTFNDVFNSSEVRGTKKGLAPAPTIQ